MLNNKHSKLAKAVRLALVCGAASSAFASVNAFAEDNNEDEAKSQKITITGSRIKRTNLVTASPVISVGAEEITSAGITRLEDLLNDLPQVYPGQVSGTANGSDGTATVDLRFLGPQRTLTLIDGRRMTAGDPQTGAGADINQIPSGLVERVELLTGGASSTYGSDAIAGVVNFIMKKDFEGVQFDYQYSYYQHRNDNGEIQDTVKARGFDVATGNITDGDTHNFSFIVGSNSSNGKGNVTMYGSVRDVEAILQNSRDYSGCALNGEPGSWVCGGSSTIPETRVTDFGIGPGFDFQVDGTDFVPRTSLYNYGPLNHFQRPDVRRTFGAMGHYDVKDDMTIYAEMNFMDDRSNAQIAPSGAFFVTNSLSCGNPFLSAQQFQQLCGQFGLTTADTQVAYIGRRNVEGGPRNDDLRHTSYRGVLGFKGDINESWSYDVFYNYSTAIRTEVYNNDLSSTKIARALNAVDDGSGNIVCQSVVDGSDPTCVPWNVFETGAVTQAMINYLILPLYSNGETVAKQFNANFTGDMTDAGWVMPWASSGASLALGYEKRQDRLVFSPDAGYQSGDGAGRGGPQTPVDGTLTVDEVYAESVLPVVEGADFAEYLNIELGYRHSEYDETNKNINTWKVMVDWQVNSMLKIRGSRVQATRHANINELFTPQSLGLYNMDEDPCAGATPTYTLEQCQRTGVTAARYGTIADSPAGQYNGLFGGNPDLIPEASKTKTFGVVFSPMESLDVALDWFDINVQDAISTVPADQILQDCAFNTNPAFCDLISRGPAQTLWIGNDQIDQRNVNIGFLQTAGVDFDASYKFEMADMGKIDFKLIGTYLTKWDNLPTPTSDVIECLGYWDRSSCGNPTPKVRANFNAAWTTPWDATLLGTIRYMGGVDELDGTRSLPSQTYLDVAANYDIMENTTVRVGINNLLDKEPPLIGNAPSGIANGNTFPGSYDYLGRYIFVGVTYTL